MLSGAGYVVEHVVDDELLEVGKVDNILVSEQLAILYRYFIIFVRLVCDGKSQGAPRRIPALLGVD